MGRHFFLRLSFSLAALLAELLALISLFGATGSLSAGQMLSLVGAHLFCAMAAGTALRLAVPDEQGDDPAAAWRIGFSLALLLPGYGPLVAVVLALRPPGLSRDKEEEEELSPMAYRHRQAEAQLLAEAAEKQADANVEALGEALKDQDKAKRLGAVEALRSQKDKRAVELLNKSLNNTLFEVRFNAVEALTGINKTYAEQIAQATAQAERQQTPASFRALGDLYYEYASLEMEETSIQEHLYRNTVDYLRRSLSSEQGVNLAVLDKIAVSLEKLGEWEEAKHTYLAVLKHDPEDFSALLGLARLHYQQREYDALRATCLRLLETPQTDPQLLELFQFWAGGSADPQPRASS